jgi:hypothetical protein
MRRLLLMLVFGRRASPRGVVVRSIEHALRGESFGLSRRQANAITHRVMATLDQLGFRF